MGQAAGYGGGSLAPLGSVNPNPALFSNRVHTFVARGVEPIREIRPVGTEETAVELMTAADVREAVATGRIDHALVVVALCRWFLTEGA